MDDDMMQAMADQMAVEAVSALLELWPAATYYPQLSSLDLVDAVVSEHLKHPGALVEWRAFVSACRKADDLWNANQVVSVEYVA